MSTVCGIDFGTSNSTLGVMQQDAATLLPLEGSNSTLPSALFFNFDENHTYFGQKAIDEYIDGEYGRLLRSLKSILGTSLMQKATHVGRRQVSYTQILTEFINELKHRAEKQIDEPLTHLVAGRPVHFVDGDKVADDLAQNTLEEIYKKVGFKEIEFQFEPIAAAIDYEQQLNKEELALIVDIGGGTSDFTVIRLSPERHLKTDRQSDILATLGVHIGGNDFDRRFNLAKAMPALGLNSYMQGSSRMEMPKNPYFDLATWHLIQNQYERKNIQRIQELKKRAEKPMLIDRLLKVLEYQDGHRLIAHVEHSKIQLTQQLDTDLDLSFVEKALHLPCQRSEFDQATLSEVQGIEQTIQQTLQAAQVLAEDIESIFLTGGTTGLTAIRHTVKQIFPNSNIVAGDRFGSVGSGLTIDASRRFS